MDRFISCDDGLWRVVDGKQKQERCQPRAAMQAAALLLMARAHAQRMGSAPRNAGTACAARLLRPHWHTPCITRKQTHDPRVWNATRGVVAAAHGDDSPPPFFSHTVAMMRALIVDDEPSIRFVVREALTARHWTVDEIDDGSAVEERLEATRYDLLVLDLYMPGMNGFEVLRSVRQPLGSIRPLRRTGPAVPVIALSGVAGGDGLTFAARLGANACLAKPFEVSELVAAMRACAVGQPRPR